MSAGAAIVSPDRSGSALADAPRRAVDVPAHRLLRTVSGDTTAPVRRVVSGPPAPRRTGARSLRVGTDSNRPRFGVHDPPPRARVAHLIAVRCTEAGI